MEKQKPLTKGRAAFLVVVSALVAIVSVLELPGWHVYIGLALFGVGIVAGFLRWNRKYSKDDFPEATGNGGIM